MRIKRIASVFFYLLLSSSLRAETIEVLAIDYPPFTAKVESEKGPLFSILKDFVDERLPGNDIKAVFVPPARAALLLSKGQYCMSFYPPQDRSNQFKFIQLSKEKVKLGLIRLREEEPFTWKTLSDLKGQSLAILRPHKGGQVLKDIVGAGLRPIYVESISQGLLMLSKKRVNYAFGDNKTLTRLSKELKLDKELFQFSTSTLHEAPVGIHVRKSCKLGL